MWAVQRKRWARTCHKSNLQLRKGPNVPVWVLVVDTAMLYKQHQGLNQQNNNVPLHKLPIEILAEILLTGLVSVVGERVIGYLTTTTSARATSLTRRIASGHASCGAYTKYRHPVEPMRVSNG